jgi:predicted hydrocarbon binding protein
MSDKNSKINLLLIGVVGTGLGYLIGKNFGSKISKEVKRVTDHPEDIKESLEKFRENSGEILEDVKDTVSGILQQLNEKINTVDSMLSDKKKDNEQE